MALRLVVRGARTPTLRGSPVDPAGGGWTQSSVRRLTRRWLAGCCWPPAEYALQTGNSRPRVFSFLSLDRAATSGETRSGARMATDEAAAAEHAPGQQAATIPRGM